MDNIQQLIMTKVSLETEKETLERKIEDIQSQIDNIRDNQGKIRVECEYCKGSGKVIDPPPDPQITPLMESCEECGGLGYHYMKPYGNEIVYFSKVETF